MKKFLDEKLIGKDTLGQDRAVLVLKNSVSGLLKPTSLSTGNLRSVNGIKTLKIELNNRNQKQFFLCKSVMELKENCSHELDNFKFVYLVIYFLPRYF